MGLACRRVIYLRGDCPLYRPCVVDEAGDSVLWGSLGALSPDGGRGTKGIHEFLFVPRGPIHPTNQTKLN